MFFSFTVFFAYFQSFLLFLSESDFHALDNTSICKQKALVKNKSPSFKNSFFVSIAKWLLIEALFSLAKSHRKTIITTMVIVLLLDPWALTQTILYVSLPRS